MEERSESIDSIFRYILIAARRAEQLMGGARARLTTRFAKPTVVALAELDSGAIPWQPVTAEEYEQLRQEDLVRGESEEQPLALVPVPPIPLAVVVAEGDEPEEIDEAELEDELQGPDFTDEGLEDVEESLADDLLVEEVE
jgi:DNA-directed RNA polymerase subunit K/omega